MKNVRFLLFLLLVGVMVFGLGASTARVAGQAEEGAVLLKLKYASFDPLDGDPAMPARLHLEAYPDGTRGAYIVQFKGPIQENWKEQISALGGEVMDYLPDYAFLVWMDGEARAKVASLDTVRWVGIYQPAYKLSPDLEMAKFNIYRVSLFPGTTPSAVHERLKSINTPTKEVLGERFLIMLPDRNPEILATWPEVIWIEPYLMPEMHNDVGGGVIMGGSTAWASGLTGSGMIVTVADTGIDSGTDTATTGDMHADFDNRFTNIKSWPVQSNPTCWSNAGADDGARDLSSGHGTHVLGSVAGNGSASSALIKGLAYQATLTFQALEQSTQLTGFCGTGTVFALSGIPDDLNTLFLEAYNWGSRIHSNSWGSNAQGAYTDSSKDVDEFVWNHPNMVILFSAGNEGTDGNSDGYVDEGSMGSPATAKNAITSGASDNERNTGGIATWTWFNAWPDEFPVNPTRDDLTSDTRQEMAAFSSRGPVDDGRIKPDMVAPGTNILSTRSRFITGNGWGAYSNTNYMYMGGTSMSNPLIAGAATLVREYYIEKRAHPSPSAALVKATMINSAVDISGYGNTGQEAGKPIPNNHEGWGRVNVGAATSGQRNFQDGVTITTGQTRTYTYPIISSSTPFKVTLVWSDYPASTSSAKQLVNNLDLKVTAPNGTTIYLGNRFSGGWSTTGGTADNTNNVESVYIQSPAVGTWKVEVIGVNVPQGPQPFAFVATGAFQATQTVYRVYQPVIRKKTAPPPPPPSGPTPGFWRSPNQLFEFYVTSSRTQVDDFAVRVSVSGCGYYKITHTSPVNITNDHFSVSGAFYFNGIFDSQTAAHGSAGLNKFNIPGCGSVSGGPWNWSASWINSTPPPAVSVEVEMLDMLFSRDWMEANK